MNNSTTPPAENPMSISPDSPNFHTTKSMNNHASASVETNKTDGSNTNPPLSPSSSPPLLPSPNPSPSDDDIDENFIANFDPNAPLTLETQYQLA
ncbi:hypothetical protein QUB31_37645, partial [Microcoleus sp. B13-B4]